MTWDVTTPAGSDAVSQGDDKIREFKVDIQAALKANDATLGDAGAFPGASTAAPKYHYRGLKGTTAQRPAAGNYGLYVNTDTATIQRDNGTTWEDVATTPAYAGPIPAGTKMPFYQSIAPTGWTIDASVNDRFVRIVSAAGGVTGGAFSNLSHTHTGGAHTHGSSALSALIGPETGGTSRITLSQNSTVFTGTNRWATGGIGMDTSNTNSSGAVNISGSTDSGGAVATGTPSGLTHASGQHAYADFIICTKN